LQKEKEYKEENIGLPELGLQLFECSTDMILNRILRQVHLFGYLFMGQTLIPA
jgi:hypothetical protein